MFYIIFTGIVCMILGLIAGFSLCLAYLPVILQKGKTDYGNDDIRRGTKGTE